MSGRSKGINLYDGTQVLLNASGACNFQNQGKLKLVRYAMALHTPKKKKVSSRLIQLHHVVHQRTSVDTIRIPKLLMSLIIMSAFFLSMDEVNFFNTSEYLRIPEYDGASTSAYY
jgi:hypothetical protein